MSFEEERVHALPVRDIEEHRTVGCQGVCVANGTLTFHLSPFLLPPSHSKCASRPRSAIPERAKVACVWRECTRTWPSGLISCDHQSGSVFTRGHMDGGGHE